VKVFVLGIDGLTFKILDPLIENEQLPGFRRLMREGAWGILKSTIPPITPAAWMSIATGLKPAKHGVLDFLDVYWQDNHVQLSPVTRRKFAPAIWDILSSYKRRVAVINVPCTYPPDSVNGIMVSGFSTPSQQSSFTHPIGFQQELFRLVPDYQIDITKAEQYADYSNDELPSLVHRMTDGRIKLLHLVLEREEWDFVFFTVVGSDRLQHPLWKELVSPSVSDQLVEYYRRLDGVLLQVMDWLGDDGLLFVLSDHGFRGANRLFNINQLQANLGWTKIKSSIRFRNSLTSYLSKLKLKRAVEALYSTVAPQPQKAQLASDRLLSTIAVDESKVWALTYAGSVYASLFFSPSVSVTERHKILGTITAELRKTGVVASEDVFADDTLDSVLGLGDESSVDWGGPQAILLARRPWAFQGRPQSSGVVKAIETVGIHDLEGCLMVWGKGVKPAPLVQSASVYDIAPTILYALDLPLESDFDGRPLTSLFTSQHQVLMRDKTTGAIWAEVQRSETVQRKVNRLLKETQRNDDCLSEE
jgi:predicted AlkP superfamily phosphohydrolase/phosphomutase